MLFMANKKAKKTTKTPAVTKVTTTVVSATSQNQGDFKHKVFKYLAGPKDLKGWFSAKTLSVFFVEMIGAMILAIIFSFTQGAHLFMFIAMLALLAIFSDFAITCFNPIFSVGAWLAHKISFKKAVVTVLAQVFGTMLAFVLFTSYLNAAPMPEAGILGGTQPEKPTIFKIAEVIKDKEWLIFGAELIGAAVFAFLAAQSLKRPKFEAAFVTAGGFFIAILLATGLLSAVGARNYLLNPVLAITNLSFTKENWQWNSAVYIIAPLLGGIIGFLIDKALVKDDKVKTTVKA